MSEMLYADDLALTSETMEGLREKFWKWKETFESRGLKVNLRKTKVVVSGAEGEVTVNKIDLCGICGKRVMANSVLCVKCRKWIRGQRVLGLVVLSVALPCELGTERTVAPPQDES